MATTFLSNATVTMTVGATNYTLSAQASNVQVTVGFEPLDATARITISTEAEAIAPHLPISVLLLGMGADMHTASLFPGADRLAEALAPDAPVLLPMRAAGAGEPRVTLSARVLRAAMAIHVMITGAEKRAALERAMDLTPQEAPIRAVLDDATVHWAA